MKTNMKTTKRYALVLLLVGLVTAGGWSGLAAKAASSPFAGMWCGPIDFGPGEVTFLVIFEDGQIGGRSEGVSYSGRVSDDGVMKLTLTQTSGRHRLKWSVTAVVGLDEEGRLVGIGEVKLGPTKFPTAFDWLRCLCFPCGIP